MREVEGPNPRFDRDAAPVLATQTPDAPENCVHELVVGGHLLGQRWGNGGLPCGETIALVVVYRQHRNGPPAWANRSRGSDLGLEAGGANRRRVADLGKSSVKPGDRSTERNRSVGGKKGRAALFGQILGKTGELSSARFRAVGAKKTARVFLDKCLVYLEENRPTDFGRLILLGIAGFGGENCRIMGVRGRVENDGFLGYFGVAT